MMGKLEAHYLYILRLSLAFFANAFLNDVLKLSEKFETETFVGFEAGFCIFYKD